MVLSCHSSGKCKYENDWVYLLNGTRVRAKDLVGKTFIVLSYNGSETCIREASAEWNGSEEVLEITTESGKQIRVTKKHPLWKGSSQRREHTVESVGWTDAGDLKVGDCLATTGSFGYFGSETCDNPRNLAIETFDTDNIPESVYRLGRNNLLLYLQNIVDDSKKFILKNKYEDKIKLYFNREGLARDMAFLFLKYGIRTRVYQKSDKWVVCIISREQFRYLFLKGEYPRKESSWRDKNSPKNTYWEKVTEIRSLGVKETVAIGVPGTESYYGDFLEHNSYLGAGLASWNFDSFATSKTLTTGPSLESVIDVMWGELRGHRNKIPDELRFLLPKAPRMETGPEHYAEGLVAATEQGFRGRKSPHLFFIFDECDGIKAPFWEAARGMLIEENALWLCLLNPVDTTSRAKLEYDKGNFQVIEISALNHPNVIAGLLGMEKPFPGIDMNLNWVNNWVREGCIPIEKQSVQSGDFQWPPPAVNLAAIDGEDRIVELDLPSHQKELFWRPKPESGFQPRVLGTWPEHSSIAIWTGAMIKAALKQRTEDTSAPIEIGCDPAEQGMDETVIFVRRGITALHIESAYGWDTVRVAERLKQLATKWAKHAQMTPEDVPVRIDCTSTKAIYDLRDNFNFIPVNFAVSALEPKIYRNRRSELWFATRNEANKIVLDEFGNSISQIDLSRIEENYGHLWDSLKRQLTSAQFFIRAGGIFEVEPKEKMKARLKESPDHADAFNLAFAPYDASASIRTRFLPSASRRMNNTFGRRLRK